MSTKLAKMVADFSTTLATAIAISGTSFTLQSIVDDDGNNLPDGNYYFTLDGNNASKEHIFCAISGASVTSVKSISRQGSETNGVVRAHRVGAQVVITDFAHILRINQLLTGETALDGSKPLAYDTDPSITDDKQIATKKYVDDTALQSAPNASTTTKGVTKLSTAPASATNPIAVGDNDNRVSPVSLASLTADKVAALAGTGTPSASNKFVTADTDALKELLANKDTDGTLSSNSDTKYASQKATKTYVDGKALTFKNGTTTYDLSTASGIQNIAHGLGKTPKKIRITAMYVNSTLSVDVGVYNGTTTSQVVGYNNSGSQATNDDTNMIAVYKAGSVQQLATVTFDGTNIILSWTKSGSITGTLYILWEAEG